MVKGLAAALGLRALDRKVVRDLWHLRGQVTAVGLVIASGVAVLVMALSTLDALYRTTDVYYERYRLAHVFGQVKRAPESVARRIESLSGVQAVQTRVVRYATLDIPEFNEPAMAQFVSVPETGQPRLNQLVLRQGRWVAPGRRDEVILNEPFAEAHGIAVGSRLVAILNGHRHALSVVGIGMSPEFIYSLGPGALMPDDKRFAVIWMSREALSAVFDLKGAFNDVSLALTRGTSAQTVIQHLDRLLERYGGVGAIPRADQISNWFVMNEIDQLATMSYILPTIFLAIAAFLTNMLLGRLLTLERSQIGLLKAFGYSNWEVGLHYGKIVLGIALLGIVIGVGLGIALGRWNTELYADIFRFPILLYRPSMNAIAIAGGATLLAALAGGAAAVAKAVRLPPAEAMQPPSPPTFRRSWLSLSAVGRWLDQPTRIIVRNIGRWPGRSCLTGLGLAASVALLVLALQWNDALRYLAESYFFNAQRQHVLLGMSEPQSERVLEDMRHLPGVLAVEPMRMASADFAAGVRTHRGSLTGVAEGAVLQPIYDDRRQTDVPAPAEGLVLGSFLADKLGVGIGDEVWVSVLQGRRPERALPVVDIVDTHIGMPAFMSNRALNRLLQEPRVQYVSLLIDRTSEAALYAELKEVPLVATVLVRQAAIDSFHEVVVDHVMSFITIFAGLACIMGFGVAYNSARITLSERGRELATLRVLGFQRGEISYILLGEVGLLIALGLPVGCVLGYWLSNLMAASFNTELFRIPLHIEPSTYGVAVVIALTATLVSALIVRARVDRLDLIEVLKSRE